MLDAFFRPNSVAIIGASRNPSKLGYAVLANLIESKFTGRIYPVNPTGEEILGYVSFPQVADLPETPDLAVIVIPYLHVPDAVQACGEKGIKAVVVISAGFRETGRAGLELELKLLQIAKQFEMRLIGPNCLGVMDIHHPVNVTFAAGGMPMKGSIAFMSQSGALGTAVLDMSMGNNKHIGFSAFVSLGNKGDVSEIDLMRYWANDPNTKVILAYSEGLPSGQEFMQVAREVSRKKPVIMLKSGVTQSGQKAVSSHTGSLAGAEQAYNAAFYQSGVLRVNNLQTLFDHAVAFAYQPLLKGNRIAIVTNAGGPGILATDALEKANLQLARLENTTIKTLEEFLPDAASAANPVDVLGDARADRYEFALKHVAADPNVDGMIVILTPQAMTEIDATAHAIGKLTTEIDKPVLGCLMGDHRVQTGIEIMAKFYTVPNYAFPERAAHAFAAMRDYSDARKRDTGEIRKFEVDKDRVKALFEKVRAENRVSMIEAESREVFAAYGFRMPRSELATTPDEAVRLADEMGYPVVLKIASPDILHKTEVGGVKVNLRNATEVRDAFELMVYRATRYVPGANIWGCLVQEMVPPGLEVLLGMSRDPQFGALVTFGLGGIYVEVLKDVTFRIAPFGETDASTMLREIRAAHLLDGVRGQKPTDKEALTDALQRISQLVTDFPEIAELDINPLFVYEKGRGVLALDARIILQARQ
ncbi:MAG: acyl-CoA synthetase [Chloroflexota bacterium]|nr:CoA-binding protein [Chloroflexota bacterium]NOG64676.1 acetate--CoA ligase family protein [Chloroflexota bacterium]GIK66327.1 MAG: acyl-CoA synthetase [Chloroflexota bacterium]